MNTVDYWIGRERCAERRRSVRAVGAHRFAVDRAVLLRATVGLQRAWAVPAGGVLKFVEHHTVDAVGVVADVVHGVTPHGVRDILERDDVACTLAPPSSTAPVAPRSRQPDATSQCPSKQLC